MGRQFSFFLGPNDQAHFEEALRSCGDVEFLKNWVECDHPLAVASSCVTKYGEEHLSLIIARRSMVNDLVLNRTGYKEFRSIDVSTQPIVEFDRCFVNRSFMRAGRLYRQDRYWSDNRQVTKPVDFIEWADRLFRLGKKSLTHIGSGFYAGSEALRLRANGVAFEQFDIPIGSMSDSDT